MGDNIPTLIAPQELTFWEYIWMLIVDIFH